CRAAIVRKIVRDDDMTGRNGVAAIFQSRISLFSARIFHDVGVREREQRTRTAGCDTGSLGYRCISADYRIDERDPRGRIDATTEEGTCVAGNNAVVHIEKSQPRAVNVNSAASAGKVSDSSLSGS